MPGPCTTSLEGLRRSLGDVEQLLLIFATAPFTSKRGEKLEVLNKSGIILITAAWENYCRGVAAEFVFHIADHGRTWQDVPMALRRRIAQELINDRNEVAVWRLAGEGWRSVFRSRVQDRLARGRWGVQSASSSRVSEFFAKELGVNDIQQQWQWTSVDSTQATAKLDSFVNIRHDVAHGRSQAGPMIYKSKVKVYRGLVIRLAEITDKFLESQILTLTDSSMLAHGIPK
jgi:RiboL-PSP-HEPN